jgi:hypothetical protein
MADQKFIVGYRAEDKASSLTVEASEVIREGPCWKITGSKGTLWISAEAFLYAYPEAMFVKKASPSGKLARGSLERPKGR